MKEWESLAVGTQIRVLHAYSFLLGSLNEHRSGSVAEEYACSAVLIVDERRHLVGTYHDYLLVASALNHCSGNVERIKESAAGCLKIECESVLQSEFAKYYRRCRGELVVGSGSGYNQRINCVGINAGLLQELLGCLAGHVACAETFLGEDVALLDADTCHNPLVTGVYHAREFLVVEDIVGHVSANAGDYCVYLSHFTVRDYSATSLTIATLPR